MNRSLYRRALQASLRTFDDDYGHGGVEFAAVLPRSLQEDPAFQRWGARPFGYGRWWKPQDWGDPGGEGTVRVAFDRGDGPEVWVANLRPDPSGHQEPVSLYNILDKPWRVRWGEGSAGCARIDADWGAEVEPFEELWGRLGFLPVMDEWLWSANPLYGGRWYLPLGWTPYEYPDGPGWSRLTHPADRDSGLRDVVSYLDGLRRRWGATIRVYPDRPDDSGRLHRSSPGELGIDARYFLRGIEQWTKTGIPADGKTYVLR